MTLASDVNSLRAKSVVKHTSGLAVHVWQKRMHPLNCVQVRICDLVTQRHRYDSSTARTAISLQAVTGAVRSHGVAERSRGKMKRHVGTHCMFSKRKRRAQHLTSNSIKERSITRRPLVPSSLVRPSHPAAQQGLHQRSPQQLQTSARISRQWNELRLPRTGPADQQ